MIGDDPRRRRTANDDDDAMMRIRVDDGRVVRRKMHMLRICTALLARNRGTEHIVYEYMFGCCVYTSTGRGRDDVVCASTGTDDVHDARTI